MHCFGPDGKLDHEGVNYLRAFTATGHPQSIRRNDPTCIEEVIEWLDAGIHQLEQQFCNEIQQKQLDYLRDERQLLNTWRCRNMVEGPKKEALRQRGQAEVQAFIDDAIIGRNLERKIRPIAFPWRSCPLNICSHTNSGLTA